MSSETVKVTLPTDVVKTYEEQGKSRGNRPVEWVMSERLRQFAGVNWEKPLTIDDPSRRELEKLLKRNVSTPEELVRHMKNALSVQAAGMEVPLPPALLNRLQSRSIGVAFEKFLPDLIVRLLEAYAGLR